MSTQHSTTPTNPISSCTEDEEWESCTDDDEEQSSQTTRSSDSHQWQFGLRSRAGILRWLRSVRPSTQGFLHHINMIPEGAQSQPLYHIPYKYDALKVDEIRILELLPGARYEPISCRFRHVTVDTDIDYEAVSYAWGQGPADRLILIDKYSFRVSETVEAALIEFRSDVSESEGTGYTISQSTDESYVGNRPQDRPYRSRATRFIWIDAICINQADLEERHNQIQLMRKIYERARKLLIWLGSEADYSAYAIYSIMIAVSQMMEGDLAYRQWVRGLSPLHTIRAYSAIAKLFARPWFTRAWVLQEYWVSGPTKSIFYCGPCQVNAWIIQEFITAREDLRYPQLLDGSRRSVRRALSLLQEWAPYYFSEELLLHPNSYISSRLAVFDSDFRRRRSAKSSWKIFPVDHKMDESIALTLTNRLRSKYHYGLAQACSMMFTRYDKWDDENPFVICLNISRRLKATDPRDHVYSILGIVENLEN